MRAQGELGISQPAISAHIANLEQRLNVRLCNRGPQGFSLTPLGREILDETNQLLSHLDSYATRLNEIGTRAVHRVRIGVVDCLTTDPANPLAAAIKSVSTVLEDLRISIGVYDYLDCLNELRSGRLDIAIVSTGLDELAPEDLEAQHLYDEISGLYCSTDHPCCSVSNPGDLSKLLKTVKISANSFLSNPIDETLDINLLDETAEISQSNIESTAYLALAGTHVGLIPEHYAQQWLQSGELVAVAPETYSVLTQIHAVRVRSAAHADVAKRIWRELATS